MSLINEFLISSLLPVEALISSVISAKTEIHAGSEITADEISNQFDEIVAKKDFSFTWEPPPNFQSTFISIKASESKKPQKTKAPKSKEPRKFGLALSAKLRQEKKLVWSRQLDFKNAWVKDAGPGAQGRQHVNIGFESATLSKAVPH